MREPVRPATAEDLERFKRRRPQQPTKWPWAQMAAVPGRSFVLQAGTDYGVGKEFAPDQSARKWAERRGIKVEVRRRDGAILVTFEPPKRGTKFDTAIAAGREWVPCKAHERERASRVARAHKMRAEFVGNKVRFLPRSPVSE